MNVVAGTYEELILGYNLVETDDGWQLQPNFTDHSHAGCVKCISTSDTDILASGSSDETVHLFNLSTRVEFGSLMQHEGSVTNICFHGGSHMFTASEDGSICIWKTANWECIKTLKGHKDAVNAIAVHPSGKLLLSVSKDKTLRTWNLVTGRSAFVINLKQAAESVIWSPDGNTYSVLFGNWVDVYSVETGNIKCKFESTSKLHTAVYIKPSILAVGGEEGLVQLFDTDKEEKIHEFNTRTNRVRSIACSCHIEDGLCLVTASSDGNIKAWDLDLEESPPSSSLLAKVNTTFRLTCLCVSKGKTESNPDEQEEEDLEEMKQKSHGKVNVNGKQKTIVEGKKQKKKNEELIKTGASKNIKRKHVVPEPDQAVAKKKSKLKKKQKLKKKKT